MPASYVDYVVVGAGTAGCVLANRLSVDPYVKIALVELGGIDSNPAIYEKRVDAMFSLWNSQGSENWGYTTLPQAGLNGRTVEITRGKVLGGCSSINAMLYVRGHQRDFAAWSQMGNRGWSYQEVLPYFKKSEMYHGHMSQYHGDNGPVSVIDYPGPAQVSHAFIEAAAELGATRKYNDFNGASQEAGAGFYQSTRTPAGIRVSAASAFLRPALARENLRLLSQTRVIRLLFEQGRVCGIECAGPDGLETIHAEREVILCCGTFETPKLMMLSGLGAAEQLAAHGIPVIQDLPGVGKNLQDHLSLGVTFESLIALDPSDMLAEAGLFMWTQASTDQASPDLQYFFAPFLLATPEYRTYGQGFSFVPILAQPQSRGTVTLASHDPTALARVDPQYLSHERDLEVLAYGMRYARELAHSSAFNWARGRELAPGEAVTETKALYDYIRATATTVWHPAGTCRMGADREAVVDDQLRVHGVEGLRIVDASVMPKLVNGNPNAAVMMIAEKAADLIRYGHAEISTPAASLMIGAQQ
ncbi:MAG TPA: GMC family oxidoreductase N-terminal domain-containing protein [Ktedonobacteraceae bacterium]